MHFRVLVVAFSALAVLACSSREPKSMTAAFPSIAGSVTGNGLGFVRTAEGYVATPPAGDDALKVVEVAIRRREGLGVRLPLTGTQIAVTLPSGDAVTVKALGLTGAPVVEDRAVSYTRAGGRSWFTVNERGFEEWVEVDALTQDLVAEWTVDGAALRASDGVVALVDRGGATVGQITAPYAIDEAGVRQRAWLEVSGQKLSLKTAARGHVLVDPLWSATSNLVPRFQHTATLLPNGRVLVVGGRSSVNAAAPVSSSQLYDPYTGTWTTTAVMPNARYHHSATLLRSGRVLIAGGDTSSSVLVAATNSAVIYDPANDTWQNTSNPLSQARYRHTATLLSDGRVLIAGGEDTNYNTLASAEIFSETAGNTLNPTGSMAVSRSLHSAVLLQNGKVLLVGGETGPENMHAFTGTAEIYDPSGGGTWSSTTNNVVARARATATLMPNGTVLVIGGGNNLPDVDVFNPATSNFVNGVPLPFGRASHTAVLTPDGRLVVSGCAGSCSNAADTQVFDPSAGMSGGWVVIAGGRTRGYATATLLPTGKILNAGGASSSTVLGNADLYDPTTATFSAGTTFLNSDRLGHTATVLPDGRILVVGGENLSGPQASAELYSPLSDTWTPVGSMSIGRKFHGAALLNDGRVLVCGGLTPGASQPPTATCELFSPATLQWKPAGSLSSARSNVPMVLLRDGRVLTTGGVSPNSPWRVSEVFDPVANTWSSTTGLPATGRVGHTLTLLSTGQVLMVGGQVTMGTGVTTSELFNPTTGLWSTTGNVLGTGRYGHTATVLPSGKVLVVGGISSGGSRLASSELFDPLSNTWSAGPVLAFARHEHSAALMRDGRVLITGGNTGGAQGETNTERYDPASGTSGNGEWATLPSVPSQGVIGSVAVATTAGTVQIIGGRIATPINTVQHYSFAPAAVSPALAPTLTAPIGLVAPNMAFSLSGTRFTGVNEGGWGGTLSSNSNVPLLEFELVSSGNRQRLPLSSWSATSLTTATGVGAGVYWARVIVNGAWSSPIVLSVFPPLGLSPLNPSVAPRGSVVFTGTGSSGSDYRWALSVNSSGASIDGGLYVAGATGGVTDTVRVSDAYGTNITTNVNVGPGVSITSPVSSLAPKGSAALTAGGGSNSGFTWSMQSAPSGGSVAANGTYTAGATGSVSDVVLVTDSLGNTATRTIAVTAGVSISPSSVSLPPRGAQTFTASGGSGSGYTWELLTNNSGATFVAGMARYTAGSTPNVTDTVRVTDSLNNQATVSISVGPALQVSPSTPSLAPRQSVNFTAQNGQSPYSWAFTPTGNASGGSINGSTGAYSAGTTGNVSDTIRVTDVLGNTANATITVGPTVSISPSSATSAPRGFVGLSASGGAPGGYTWVMASNPSGGTVAATGIYQAGPSGNVTDFVNVIDTAGNIATASISVGPGVSISPLAAMLAPRATRVFTASGGTDAGFVWDVSMNNSGGSVDGGVYVAGVTGLVTDTVRVRDSNNNESTVNVTVTAGVGISPSSASTPPLGIVAFAGSGGSGAPYTWAITTNASGGSINAAVGTYTAGPVEGVDSVRATDSLGNTFTTTVTVTNALAVTPKVVTIAPRATQLFSATGGSGTGYVWSLKTNNSGASFDAGTAYYQAGSIGGAVDTVEVSDSLGATATATITLGPGVSVTPATTTTTPRGTKTFIASGGGGTNFSWSFVDNKSGGTIDALSGAYVAGSTGGVTDVVQAVDLLGNSGTASVAVSAGVSIMPGAVTVPPQGAQTFTATGGSGLGFTWSFGPGGRPSGGSIDSLSGQYEAGTRGGVTDIVQARDSLGNTATVNVTVGGGVAVSPANPTTTPRGMITFSASGGSDAGFTWALKTNLSQASITAAGVYTAGTTGNVTDVVEATDSLGNVGSTNVLVSGNISLMPALANQAPRSTLTFTVMGGTAPFTWSLMTNGSGATLNDGVYVAGSTPNVTDVVKVTDSLGNNATATVQVTAGVSISPTTATVNAQGTQQFTAAGGSGTGFQWTIQSNGSGGTIDATGAYRAGATAGTDVVQVSDSLGNTASATVSVSASSENPNNSVPFSQRPPVSGWSCGCGSASTDGLVFMGVLVLSFSSMLRRKRPGPNRKKLPSRASAWAAFIVVFFFAVGSANAATKKSTKSKTPAEKVAPAPAAPAPAPPPPETPPTQSLVVPAPVKKEKPTVAVLDVEVTVPNEKLDAAAFSEMLVSTIDSSGMFRVTSAKDMVTMLGIERQRALMGCEENASCMAEFANALGTELVLIATVGKVADSYLVTARLIEGQRSRVAARGSVQAKDPNMLLSAIWQVTQQTIDAYGASLPAEQAEVFAKRPKPPPPTTLGGEAPSTPSSFGVTVGAIAGYQVLSTAGNRGSIGIQVDGTFRYKRFDLAAGIHIGPNIGIRLAVSYALIDSRFRLMAGARGATFPGLSLFGGGPVVLAEFAFTPWLAASAVGGADFFPSSSGVVIVLLGTLGVAMHF